MNEQHIIPMQPKDFVINGRDNKEIIKISAEGDIYIKGELVTNNIIIARYMISVISNNHKNIVYELLENDPILMQEVITKIRKNKLLKLK